MTDPSPSASRAAGTVTLGLGVLALGLYAVLGVTSEGTADVPASRFILAALLVATGSLIRTGRGPRWAVYVAAALAGIIAVDLILALL